MMPNGGISSRFSARLTASATIALAMVHELRPAITRTTSTAPQAVATSMVRLSTTMTRRADGVAAAEDPQQVRAEHAEQQVDRPGEQDQPDRRGPVDQPRAAAVALRHQRADLRLDGRADRAAAQLPEHQEPGGSGVHRGLRRPAQDPDQHHVRTLQDHLRDAADGARQREPPERQELTARGGDVGVAGRGERSRRPSGSPAARAPPARRPRPVPPAAGSSCAAGVRPTTTRRAPRAGRAAPRRSRPRVADCVPASTTAAISTSWATGRATRSTTTSGRITPYPRVAPTPRSLSAPHRMKTDSSWTSRTVDVVVAVHQHPGEVVGPSQPDGAHQQREQDHRDRRGDADRLQQLDPALRAEPGQEVHQPRGHAQPRHRERQRVHAGQGEEDTGGGLVQAPGDEDREGQRHDSRHHGAGEVEEPASGHPLEVALAAVHRAAGHDALAHRAFIGATTACGPTRRPAPRRAARSARSAARAAPGRGRARAAVVLLERDPVGGRQVEELQHRREDALGGR